MAKLATLHLENYRNIADLTIEFGGKDGKITGVNRAGKTNCIEAICYLLTDKLLGGSADIPSIKPHKDTKAKVVVEGTFLTNEGTVILRKEFYEKWTRPRGSATEELQGHATDYFINGAKQARAKDFFEKLEEKFGIPSELSGLDAYQLTIDPFYLGETICGSKDWKLARRAIIEIVGDVTPEEIYQANKNAEIAKDDLEAHQYDDGEAKKAIRGEIDGCKKRLLENEGVLREYERTLEQDFEEDELERAKAESEKLDEQIAKLKLGSENPYADEVTALQQELYKLNEEYRSLTTISVDHSKSEGIRKELREKREELSTAQLNDRSLRYERDRIQRDLEEKRALQLTYKAKLQELKGEADSIIVDKVCPTCGQELPPEKIEEAFNKKKAEILAEAQRIRELGIANKKAIEFQESTLLTLSATDYSKQLAELPIQIGDLEKELAKAVDEEKEQFKAPDPKIKERIEAINARLAEIREMTIAKNVSSSKQIEDLKAKKEGCQAIISKHLSLENARKRISEIRAANVRIGKAQADAEQRLWAVGEFVKTKLELLDQHMAKKFGEVRFQLIKENIKAGSYDEVCVPYIVDPFKRTHTKTLFPDGSKSEQIFTGIQIIKAIRDALGWEPLPIIFDQGGELDSKSTDNAAYYAEAQIIEVKVEGNATKPTFIPFAGN